MEILKIRNLEHSGQGENATHKKVIREFEKSEKDGIYYCKSRGWDVHITDIILEVKSPAMFGFKMTALIKR